MKYTNSFRYTEQFLMNGEIYYPFLWCIIIIIISIIIIIIIVIIITRGPSTEGAGHLLLLLGFSFFFFSYSRLKVSGSPKPYGEKWRNLADLSNNSATTQVAKITPTGLKGALFPINTISPILAYSYKIQWTHVGCPDVPKSLLAPWPKPNRKSAILI